MEVKATPKPEFDIALARIPREYLEKLQNQDLNIDINGSTISTRLDGEHFVGAGETAIVLKGRTDSEKTVAVKIPFPGLEFKNNTVKQARILNEFESEANLLAACRQDNHPAIPVFYGEGKIAIAGQTEIPVIVRELFPTTLENANLDLNGIKRMAEEVASGLEYLSATHGKIVTDLNPDNINQREDGSIVLSDIGLSATIGGAGPGKPKEEIGYDEIYSAPELAKGTYEELVKNVSPRNEVYSLALIIYHKLGGRIPTVMDVQMGVKDVNLIKEISGISAETLAVLKKGTSVKPEDRYASPGEFVEAFEKSL